jgi:hypothetical protein
MIELSDVVAVIFNDYIKAVTTRLAQTRIA